MQPSKLNSDIVGSFPFLLLKHHPVSLAVLRDVENVITKVYDKEANQ
jgi:hypothetical protein